MCERFDKGSAVAMMQEGPNSGTVRAAFCVYEITKRDRSLICNTLSQIAMDSTTA